MATYHFSFAWRSNYGHVVQLVTQLVGQPGPVIDLGCGYAAVAEPLTEAGFSYVGADFDADSVAAVRQRGFPAEVLDLTDLADLEARLVDLTGGKEPVAVLLLDTLEHLAPTREVLATLRSAFIRLGRPLLVLSVPNVAHFDLGAKLLTGRWEVTPTGLLDITHVALFTGQRLTDELAAQGWVEVGRHDFHLPRSDQHTPAGDPVLAPGAPLSQLLRQVRDQRDDGGSIYQFVRAYALTDAIVPLAAPHPPTTGEGPFLSVIMRTQANRLALLEDALLCLGGQSDPDFEVVLAVHTDDPDAVERVDRLVSSFEPNFAFRVRVLHVVGGGRARPLNEALDAARGRYVAFLDDDDVVTGDWVASFHRGAENGGARIVRARCATQAVQLTGDGAWRSTALPVAAFDAEFDYVKHLTHNQTPICSVAIPLVALRALGIRFDESMPVVEDWDLLMRTARYSGVLDVGALTSIYHQWDTQSGLGSRAIVAGQVWDATHRAALARFDGEPLLLPPGSVTRLITAAGGAPSLEADELRVERDEALARLAEIEGSEWWRATRPMRDAGTNAKRVARRGKRLARRFVPRPFRRG